MSKSFEKLQTQALIQSGNGLALSDKAKALFTTLVMATALTVTPTPAKADVTVREVIGGTIGAAVGSQVGGGNMKIVTGVLGALGGAAIADAMAKPSQPAYGTPGYNGSDNYPASAPTQGYSSSNTRYANGHRGLDDRQYESLDQARVNAAAAFDLLVASRKNVAEAKYNMDFPITDARQANAEYERAVMRDRNAQVGFIRARDNFSDRLAITATKYDGDVGVFLPQAAAWKSINVTDSVSYTQLQDQALKYGMERENGYQPRLN